VRRWDFLRRLIGWIFGGEDSPGVEGDERYSMTIGEFTEAVIIYCSLTGGSVTSFGRTEKHNKTVGGVKDSDHLYWRAMDVVYDEPVSVEGRKEIAERHGLFLLIEAAHDHLAPLKRSKR